MANIHKASAWQDRSLRPIDERKYLSRRTLVKDLGILSAGLLGGNALLSCKKDETPTPFTPNIDPNNFTFPGMDDFYPAQRNADYALDRPLSLETDATLFNNFYEFNAPDDPDIKAINRYVGFFDTRDWTIEVSGLTDMAGTYHLGDLIEQFGLEERLYRHRCVETWAMAVPWTGFPLSALIEFLQPAASATHIRMKTANRPEEMPGISFQTWYSWPYVEALSIEEARNELAFFATGLFGKPLEKQNGAPIRLVAPWKYGFKSIKSIVSIEFVDSQPVTFWNAAVPSEYGVVANVDPNVPHPRWSQATETDISSGDRRATLKYNGYGEMVAHLYE